MPNAVKVARWVWSRGKDGDYIKVLPIAINDPYSAYFPYYYLRL